MLPPATVLCQRRVIQLTPYACFCNPKICLMKARGKGQRHLSMQSLRKYAKATASAHSVLRQVAKISAFKVKCRHFLQGQGTRYLH